MKKYLLFALMIFGLIGSAQNSLPNGDCKTYFKYAVDNKVMSPFPSTGIDFYGGSNGNAILWFWDFGDGETSTEQNPFHLFKHPIGGPNVKMSPYRTVTLTVKTSDDCKSFYSEMINIVDGVTYISPASCKAYFKYNQIAYDSVGGKATFQLDNYSEGDSLSYYWKFEDGNTSTEKNPTVTFDIKPAYHYVSLIITGKNNCSDTYEGKVNFYDPNTPVTDPIDCYVNFGYTVNYNVKTLLPALTLDFYAKASPFVTEWNWDFGDGSTSSEQNPTHSFNLPMTIDSVLGDPNPFRNVCLTVKTSADCSPTHCEIIDLYKVMKPVEPPVQACTARYKYRPLEIDSIAGKVTFEFNNYSEGDSLSYFWTFNNGLTSTDTEIKITFDINQLPFKASLTVLGKNNCTDTMWDEVYIDRPDIYPPVDPARQCQARFKAYRPNDIVSIPEVIPYQMVDASEGNVVSWLWRFEDGSLSTEASPLVNFDFMKPTQKVCLTVYTADSLESTFCDVIYVSDNMVDTTYVPKPALYYTMRVTGDFPIQMSSCAGTAHAQVYLNDSLVEASYYTWSNGEQGQDITGLCPTQSYSVKAIAPDGNSVWSEFIFNSDGTVSEIPSYWNTWYLTGSSDNQLIRFNTENKDLIVEWHLCDGTVVVSDSIPLGLINCGGNESNMVMKDAAGNEVYAETISLKTLATRIKPVPQLTTLVKIFPNPVKDVLNIKYSGKMLNEMQLEIYDTSGKRVSSQNLYDIESGQHISINVSTLWNGIYICKMISAKQLIGQEKFVK